jgi:formamidopyrimidine-DNA glycosylase
VPELPEVETLRQDLEKEVVGRKIKGVEVKAAKVVRRHRNRKEFADRLIGRKITGVTRRGTFLPLALDSDDVLVVGLGRAGRLRKERSAAPVDKHTDAVITFATGGDLRIIDLGAVGELFVAGGAELDEIAELQHVAIDPLTDAFTWQAFNAKLRQRRAMLRPLLMDGSFVTGIGPVYSDEILWASGLHWARRSDSLSAQEVRRLYRAIQEVVQEAVRLRGTSVGNELYLDLHGDKGEYQTQLNVYEREGLPCQRCRTPIARETVDGGTTFYCPKCQS